MRKTLGEGGERSWWEVEGEWAGDGGLLGEGVAPAAGRVRGKVGSEEEEEDGEEEEEEEEDGEGVEEEV